MNDPAYDDLIRDHLAGTLSPEGEDELREALASDPSLAEVQASYEQAYRATASLARGAPPCELRPADLQLPRRQALPWRPLLLAAAAVLVALGLAFRSHLRGPATPEAEPVRLAAIPLDVDGEAEALDPLAGIPLALAGYRPADEGGVQWLHDPQAARMVARLTDRPVLRYQSHPSCPLCRKMEAGTLRASSVREGVIAFVPLRESLAGDDPAALAEIVKGGWPRFSSETPDGVVLATFNGYQDSPAFANALASAAPSKAPVAWEILDAWLQSLEEARLELAAGRPGAAWTDVETARDQAARPLWNDIVLKLEQGLADLAGRALTAARAASDPLPVLEDAATRFEGSPFAPEFRMLAARVRADGAFPPLEEAPR